MSTRLRIISLAPTQTEILAALGLAEEIVGITEDCDHPPEIMGKAVFGSWYSPDLQRTIEARPDLICTFGTHQEDMRDTLLEAGLNVYHSDPATVNESLGTIQEIASLTNRVNAADRLLAELNARLRSVEECVAGLNPSQHLRVLRIMNWNPLVTVGPGSFQNDVIRMAGGCNVVSDGPAPYFVCSQEDLIRKDPEAIFFCDPEISHFLAEDSLWRQTSAFRCGKIFIFHCGLTCRSGPRIVDMVESLARALQTQGPSQDFCSTEAEAGQPALHP